MSIKQTSSELKNDAAKYGFDYNRDGRVLVWHDEFDEKKLDTDKWCFVRTMGGGDHKFLNDEAHVRVENNELLMTADLSGDEKEPYAVSEGLTTKDTMNFRYGYAEIRAKIAYRHGAWPSWWMQGCTKYQEARWWMEVDIYEQFSSKDTIACALHKHKPPKDGAPWESSHQYAALRGHDNKYHFKNYENLNDEYHIYGYEWTPERMSFYVDGECYCSFDTDEAHDWDNPDVPEIDPNLTGALVSTRLPGMEGFRDHAFFIFNNEFFTAGNGFKDSEWHVVPEDFPIQYHLDYIRLWQNPETDSIKYPALD